MVRNRSVTTALSVKGTNNVPMMFSQSVVGPIGFRVRVPAVQGPRMEMENLQGAGVVVLQQSTRIILLKGLLRLMASALLTHWRWIPWKTRPLSTRNNIAFASVQ